MTSLVLHLTPLTSAFVSLAALEETGAPFQVERLALMKGDQRQPGYLALNPKGQVPALVVDGRVLTENVAILVWLSGRFPEAKLLPDPGGFFERTQVLADLAFCASTLQPFTARIRMAWRICESDQGRVRAQAIEQLQPQFDWIEARLAAQTWWYGADWSMLDVYLYWVWTAVTREPGLDPAPYPALARHAAATAARPSVQRARAREAAIGAGAPASSPS